MRGGRCDILWGAGPPTSEFPAHLAIHAMCLEKRPEMRAVLHTHPPYLIAMSHLPAMQEPCALDNALRKMHPEVSILVPDGIDIMDYRIPGSVELGLATRDALEKRNLVVWPMHGVVSVAADIDHGARSGGDSREGGADLSAGPVDRAAADRADRQSDQRIVSVLGNREHKNSDRYIY